MVNVSDEVHFLVSSKINSVGSTNCLLEVHESLGQLCKNYYALLEQIDADDSFRNCQNDVWKVRVIVIQIVNEPGH